MLLKKGEVCRALKSSEKISFSKDVADTLGVESAIILELYQTQKISNSRDVDAIKESLSDIAPFLDQNNLEKNIDIPICLWDERLSTVGAFNLSSQLDVNVSKREKKIDENAAAFILQGAIDFLNN